MPHFEKMLYDQAQLAVCYTEAFQVQWHTCAHKHTHRNTPNHIHTHRRHTKPHTAHIHTRTHTHACTHSKNMLCDQGQLVVCYAEAFQVQSHPQLHRQTQTHIHIPHRHRHTTHTHRQTLTNTHRHTHTWKMACPSSHTHPHPPTRTIVLKKGTPPPSPFTGFTPLLLLLSHCAALQSRATREFKARSIVAQKKNIKRERRHCSDVPVSALSLPCLQWLLLVVDHERGCIGGVRARHPPLCEQRPQRPGEISSSLSSCGKPRTDVPSEEACRKPQQTAATQIHSKHPSRSLFPEIERKTRESQPEVTPRSNGITEHNPLWGAAYTVGIHSSDLI